MNETLNLKYQQKEIHVEEQNSQTETNNSCESLELDLNDRSEKAFKSMPGET